MFLTESHKKRNLTMTGRAARSFGGRSISVAEAIKQVQALKSQSSRTSRTANRGKSGVTQLGE